MLALLAACTSEPAGSPAPEPEPDVVPWTHARPPLDEVSPTGRAWKRGVIHLHSYLSHDACDNHSAANPDDVCFDRFRAALCDAGLDYAFVTDHPASAGEHPYEEILLSEPGDTALADGNLVACADGRAVLTMPGIEDELMPIGLDRHVSDDPAVNDAIYNGTDATTFAEEAAAGAAVMQAHTEGKSLDELYARQAMGLVGVEIFNLHAMVDPTKREEDLGLDAFAYLEAAGPFISGETDAEPDLVFLSFYEEQGVSLERWDALNRVAFTVGTAGTDAHENAIPSLMADGERVDSYRRMISWFGNVVLPDGDSPADFQAAVEAGRLFVAFEALGVPSGFDVRYGELEHGGEGEVGGTLEVGCPTLAADSPRDGEDPDVDVVVLKDGVEWQRGCGAWSVTEPGVYRVRVDIVPHHLAGFLDDRAEALVHAYPWLYGNAFRLGL
ncbi:MAG: hypothetical protein ACOZNI_14730 [Myxococcota bacterium]